ncbi:MAG: flagellar basal body P-ring protein FlgI [Fibrobacteria bacterium]|nr:flagellar basal body P-ring protein FlgI [Fibrobacteria bacterium]
MFRYTLFTIVIILAVSLAQAVKIKDVAHMSGLTDMQLTGFGLVVGLRNTGDGPQTIFTTKGVANMLRNLGIQVPQSRVRVRNVAAVMVVAEISPFLTKGSKVDVSVSSIGDARSLEGGTLLMAPLSGADGKIYAVGQGAVSIGGYNYESKSGLSSYRKNHSVAGQIPDGAIVQRGRMNQVLPDSIFKYTLNSPDFNSAVKMAEAINKYFKSSVAKAKDAASVEIIMPANYGSGAPVFLAEIEGLDFIPDDIARVVMNEKTGTIVAGGAVTISSVAVSHGSLTISINTEKQSGGMVAQGRKQWSAGGYSNTSENAMFNEPKAEVKVLPRVTSVSELARALNSLGVPPRDIIAIFQSIKKAGALHAELVMM